MRPGPWRLLSAACVLIVAATVGARAEPLRCRSDDRLSEAAAALLLHGEPLVASSLLVAARQAGYDGVSLHARENGSDESLARWLSQLQEGAAGTLECGEAFAESRRLTLASLRRGRLRHERGIVRGELAPGFSAPKLIIESTEGELRALTLSVAQLEAGVTLRDANTPRRIQLMAEGRDGPAPVAELSFAPAPAPPPAASGPKTRSRSELLTTLEALRGGQRLGKLRPNRLLEESATRHAARVCATGKLAHRLEGEDPELRLRREHVAARAVGEALARAESADLAFHAMFASPGHRLALRRRDFTDVGVGQATDAKGQVCLVVLMAAWPRRIP